MGYSKRQFVNSALEEIGLARYSFDILPEQEESCIQRLDAMMADWNASGIRINYPLPGSPENSDIDAASGVPDAANLAIIQNLACLIAPQFGRQVMIKTEQSAARSLNVLRGRFAVIPQRRIAPGTPLGAGNRPWDMGGTAFVQHYPVTVDAGPDQQIEV